MMSMPDPAQADGTAAPDIDLETDPEEITTCDILDAVNSLHADLHELHSNLAALASKVEVLTASHNQVGENIAWLVANTQGLFQMLSDPNLVNSMMSGVLGGGQPGQPG